MTVNLVYTLNWNQRNKCGDMFIFESADGETGDAVRLMMDVPAHWKGGHMTVKEVEERTGLPRSNIRFYEKEGLVRPRRNEGNGYRDYSEQDVEELRKVAWLRTLEISLEDIRSIVNRQEDLHSVLLRRIPLLEKEMEKLQDARRLCELLAREKTGYEDLDIDRYVEDPKAYWRENGRTLRLDAAAFVSAWGGRLTWAIVTALSLLAALAALWLLPEQIPIQWSGGQAVSYAGRGMLFACPAACVAVRLFLRPQIGAWLRRNTMFGSIVTDYVANYLCLVVLSVEVFIFLYVWGIFHSVAAVLLADTGVLAILLWLAGKKMTLAQG